MLSHDERSRRTFGRRRIPEGMAGLPASLPGPASHPARPRRAAGPLPWTLRMAGLVGILTVVAAYQLARLSRPDAAPTAAAVAALAGPAHPGIADPQTTGALAASEFARSTRLDPCLVPASDRLRP